MGLAGKTDRLVTERASFRTLEKHEAYLKHLAEAEAVTTEAGNILQILVSDPVVRTAVGNPSLELRMREVIRRINTLNGGN